MLELVFLQFSGYYAYPEPNIPDYQTEYTEHRVWVPWVKREWKETVEVVEESEMLSDRDKDTIIKDMRIPLRCIKTTLDSASINSDIRFG